MINHTAKEMIQGYHEIFKIAADDPSESRENRLKADYRSLIDLTQEMHDLFSNEHFQDTSHKYAAINKTTWQERIRNFSTYRRKQAHFVEMISHDMSRYEYKIYKYKINHLMTTTAFSQGPTEVINARRTESLDAPAILDLVYANTIEQFGQVNIVHLIEKANLAVTLINEDNEVLGFAGFLDYPPLEVCPEPAKWESWLSAFNPLLSEKCSPLNSLFLHYFVARPDYTIGCASEIVRTVFNAVPELHFLFLTLRTNVEPEQAISEIFCKVDAANEGDHHHALYACYRHMHIPVLHIRKAVVEDSDDLTPILSRLNNSLKETYGDHFLAEMIEAQNEDNHALVAEVGGKAIGFISMCSHVNVDLLQKQYELAAFHGLRKRHPDDKLKEVLTSDNIDDGNIAQSESHASILPEDNLKEESASNFSDHETPDEDANTDNKKVDDETDFTVQELFEPCYFGHSNCFSIQLFCIDERYEMRSADFLPYVFRYFPDKEFAVITTPHLVPEFPLLQHFVRATPRNLVVVDQELYIFNKAGLLADFSVRPVFTKDTEEIEHLLGTIDANTDILADIKEFNSARRDDDGSEIQAFVAECIGQIVGVAVLRREEDIEYIRSHFNIEDFIYFNHHRRDEHGHLHHFALNPVFQHYTKHFFKEILRQGNKSCLFYPVYEKNQCDVKKHSLVTGLNYLVPVRARRQIIYPFEELKQNAPSERVVKVLPPYALYHMNRKLTLEPKVTINARIVVVGASSVAISFLETLTFCPHLRFNNLTVVSKDGLSNEISDANYTYTFDQLASMSLQTWVNVVKGFMVAIDRSHKQILLQNGKKLAYDFLLLCTGQQYQVPKPTLADLENGATNHVISPRSIDTPLLTLRPDNVMTINSAEDKARVLSSLSESQSMDGKIVVYGNSLDAFFVLQSLLSSDVEGKYLVLVQPPRSESARFDTFYEPPLVKRVMSAISEAGVEVHTDCILATWKMNPDKPNTVNSVGFTTPTKPLIIPCHMLLSFHPKCIDGYTFRALNDACLVFDGRLVIKSNFCTNDACIRAAGPLTKYARRYHAEEWSNHDWYNSCEIGFRLAMSVLPLFDPTIDVIDDEFNENDPYSKLTPIFSDCKVFHGILPGDLRYLHIRKPGLPKYLESQLSDQKHGREIETGSVENGNYFRLHINQFGCVETITCAVSDDKNPALPVANIIQLYNVHERCLNNLLSRVEEGLISDLYTFFSEPWCMAAFHDRFRDLRQEVRELLNTSAGNVPSLEANVRQLVDEDQNLDRTQKVALHEFYNVTGIKKSVEKRLLSYLSYNHYHLPMYAKPGMV